MPFNVEPRAPANAHSHIQESGGEKQTRLKTGKKSSKGPHLCQEIVSVLLCHARNLPTPVS